MFILVTGGSGSGKSAFAEDQILQFGDGVRIYIATMKNADVESKRRIERHRRMRQDKCFETVEQYVSIKDLDIPEGSILLLECMSNLVANEMYDENGAGRNTVKEILEGIRHLKKKSAHFVVVTNEIFSDGQEYDKETMRYQKYLGSINQELALMADRVVEVVYGIPVYLENR